MFKIQTNAGTDKFTVDTDNGNTDIQGNVDIAGYLTVDGNATIGNSTADTVSITATVASDVTPDSLGNNRNLGNVTQKWKNAYIETIHSTTINGAVTGNITGNVSGSSGSCTGNAATATALQTARNIGGVSFDGTANINLPGVNTGGNQDTSGTATNADNVNIDEKNDSVNYQILFSDNNSTGYQRPYIDTDNGHFTYNPSSNTLGGLNVSCGTITATTFGSSSQNAYGARTVSTSNPSGGSDGDIWYKY